MIRLLFCLLLLSLGAEARPIHGGSATPVSSVSITNYSDAAQNNYQQVSHFDVAGNQIDAHDGMILQVGSTFYQYGTAYGCGFQYVGGSPATYCGVNVYSSTDMVNWTFVSQLFDPNSGTWQTDCQHYGCFRPHVIYNAAHNNYIVWINQATATATDSYFVLDCTTPTSGCVKQGNPIMLSQGGFNGDFSLFLDPNNGNGYIIYNHGGNGIYIDALNSTFTDSTGTGILLPSSTNSEGTVMFYQGGTYFVGFGPSCAYCSAGAALEVETASSAMGTYSGLTTINANSCQGQPRSVDVITGGGKITYLFSSDQWAYNAQPNQSLGNIYYQPLTISGGAVTPFSCSTSISIAGLTSSPPTPPVTDQTNLSANFTAWADYYQTPSYWRMQTFVPTSSTLSKVKMPLAQANTASDGTALSADPEVDLVTLDGSNNPVSTLAAVTVPRSSLAWNEKLTEVDFNYSGLTPGTAYGLVVKNTAAHGVVATGLYTGGSNPYPSGVERFSSNAGSSWTTESSRSLAFSTYP